MKLTRTYTQAVVHRMSETDTIAETVPVTDGEAFEEYLKEMENLPVGEDAYSEAMDTAERTLAAAHGMTFADDSLEYVEVDYTEEWQVTE